MIKSSKGSVTMEGEKYEIETDLVYIVRAFRESNKENSDEFLKERIMKAVEIGFKSDEELEEELDKKFKRNIRGSFKDDEITKGLAELIAILGGAFNGSK